MPRPSTHLLGIVLFVASACSGSQAASLTPPSPSPQPVSTPVIASGLANAPWPLDLAISGDFIANVAGTAPSDPQIRNECTGKNSARSGSWGSTMALNIAGQRYALVILAPGYKGATTFTTGVKIEVHNVDLTHVWQNRSGDAVSFTVAADEESGRLLATLSDATAPAQKLKLNGRWSCQG
jgi:hypothetical protein